MTTRRRTYPGSATIVGRPDIGKRSVRSCAANPKAEEVTKHSADGNRDSMRVWLRKTKWTRRPTRPKAATMGPDEVDEALVTATDEAVTRDAPRTEEVDAAKVMRVKLRSSNKVQVVQALARVSPTLKRSTNLHS